MHLLQLPTTELNPCPYVLHSLCGLTWRNKSVCVFPLYKISSTLAPTAWRASAKVLLQKKKRDGLSKSKALISKVYLQENDHVPCITWYWVIWGSMEKHNWRQHRRSFTNNWVFQSYFWWEFIKWLFSFHYATRWSWFIIIKLRFRIWLKLEFTLGKWSDTVPGYGSDQPSCIDCTCSSSKW